MRLAGITLVAVTAALPASNIALAKARPASATLMSKHLVPVDGSRRLNFVCAGVGSPTIVFEGGLATNLLTWQKVVEPVSRLARVCFYDRAGYGYSDPPAGPLDASHVTDDLYRLLRRSKTRLPVILVGHSVGGLYSTLYADRHISDVAGLVLIDPSFAEQDRNEPAEELAQDDALTRAATARLRRCAELARAGRLQSEEHKECFIFAPDRTAAEKAFLRYQYVRPARYEAAASETESQHSSDGRGGINSRQEEDARRSFGAIPLIVLTAALANKAGTPVAVAARDERNWHAWKDGHDQLAGRSTNGRSVVVPDTGHFIQVDQPSSVILAIRGVINMACGSS